jgi:hypothetical protein
MRTALFVDFDNICISFAELDETAAHRFATQPARWLAWFESGAHVAAGEEITPEPRRILLRRCYLNPVAFGRYRGDYTRAAFTVVDCPPLTQRGKTSADVYMVMDILDALNHPTRFDEFVILSSDADFTPVLLRLRAHDRRTTIIATNVAAAAYKAACDNVVPYERFFEEALGLELESLVPPEQTSTSDRATLLPRVAEALRDRIAADGPLTAREVPMVFASFPSFRNSNWFGCFSLKGLMARLLELEPSIVMLGDPNGAWSAVLREGASTRHPTGDGTDPGLAERIVDEVRRMLRRAPQPIPMATAAHQIGRVMGSAVRESDWLGYGAFKSFLAAHEAPDVAVLAVSPGYVYDPARHDATAVGQTEELDPALPGELAAFIRRIAGITGAPPLSPADHAVLFRSIAAAAAEDGANLNHLSAAVRERCQAEGTLVSRAQINFVLTGFRYHQVELAGCTAAELASAWCRNVRELCANAQLELSEEEVDLLSRWIVGQPEPAETTDARSEPEAAPSDSELVASQVTG